ncbi:hypothetical protein H9Q74_003591 [Fusarium xylarioides]|nr:hypothetical protein H9Q71_004236 [Fusarium xylarioides]KAG5826351.1 hypothetical protein H9Q74_003591 [Fusarium xylarioides]
MSAPNVIIIGGGAAAIAMAHTLKHKLGFNNFEIYEKREGLGGTWRNLESQHVSRMVHIENTVDKFSLRSHFRFKVECTGAEWVDGSWHVHFLDTYTGEKFTKQCTILLSAVGGFSIPRQSKFPGMDKYKGRTFHTAEWDHTFGWRNKKVAVIGNGCSAAQVVPSIAPGVKKLVQYARSPQWYHPRPNRVFSSFEKFCFRYVPLYQRYHRLDLFLQTDDLASVYGPEKQIKKRLATEAEARSYILSEAPKKYHHFIVPDFPLGCKRRIYDPGYLAALRRDNVELLPEGIQEFTETGLISEKGKPEDFDAVILATGFNVSSFLAPMNIIGKTGEELQDQWSNRRGAQAYMGTFVHNNPNFAILFGPNTFPAFNSVIYAIEVQVDYITSVFVKPIIDGYTHVVEVKEDAEEGFIQNLDRVLGETVFSAGCSNWYINKAGRNSAAWPGEAATFWKATYFPTWSHFLWTGGSSFWMLRKAWRHLKTTSLLSWLALLAGTWYTMSQGLLAGPFETLVRPFKA